MKEDDDERVGGQDAWLTIDKTIGKVDEEKVRDYMDDIDTLLVFVRSFPSLSSLVLKSILEGGFILGGTHRIPH